MDDPACERRQFALHERELRLVWEAAHEHRHKMESEERLLAKKDNDRRLDEMNQFRQQILQERGIFVSRELHDKLEQSTDMSIKALERSADARLKVLENSKSNQEGRLWMMGAGISALVVMLQLALHFFTSK